MRIELNPVVPPPPAIGLGKLGLIAWVLWLVLPGWLQALLRILVKHWMVWAFAFYVGYHEGVAPWPTFLASVLFFGFTAFVATHHLALEVTPRAPSPVPPSASPEPEPGTYHSYPLSNQPPQTHAYEYRPID